MRVLKSFGIGAAPRIQHDNVDGGHRSRLANANCVMPLRASSTLSASVSRASSEALVMLSTMRRRRESNQGAFQGAGRPLHSLHRPMALALGLLLLEQRQWLASVEYSRRPMTRRSCF